MPDCMMPFPEDWHDFLKDYSFDDSQEVYTNGSRLIPVFRVEQLIEHLLKAQEPRVITLEEVKMLDSDYYYLESMRSPGKELREIVGAYGLTCVTWPSITWARQTMGDSGYGKTWRCWTSRPTDEQRGKEPWNG